jgi:plastocyanin
MNLTKLGALTLVLCATPLGVSANSGGGSVSGQVTLNGAPPKPKTLDLSKEPDCVKLHASNPLLSENVVVGAGNSLRNVVVYISAGDSEAAATAAPTVLYNQQGCHYTTHVLAVRVGQEVKISNNDPFSHNIHPLAKVNREWNRMQPPGTPPFSYAFDREEIIPVKCNIHPWMSGYFAVLKTSHFMVTGDDGRFTLPNLPPGHYVITAWHEQYGTVSKEVTISGAESQSIDFAFTAR